MTQAPLNVIPQYIVSANDYQQQARQHLNDNAWHYLEGGASDEHCLAANQGVFESYKLQTRVLSEFKEANTQVLLWGKQYQSPLILAPIAYQTLFHAQGEQATALAAQVINVPFVVSSLSATLLEEVAQHNQQDLWFQLYFQAQRQHSLDLVQRAEKAGYQVLIVTVDAPIAGMRYRTQRVGFELPPHVQAVNLLNYHHQTPGQLNDSFVFNAMAQAPTWHDIEWLLSVTRLPVVIKGILSPEDAKLAVTMGVAGIVVSNHGGRVLDSVLPSLSALSPIIQAVEGRVPVLFDSGIRSGVDVFKALALGASMVLIGRPYIYALASAGALGVAHLLRTLREELEITMALCGCANVNHINSSCLIKPPSFLSC